MDARSLEGHLLDGRYQVGPCLGAGGMSIVHEAEDLRLSRRVAIKVLRGASSEVLIERLFREAKAAARTDHPAVVTVFGYGNCFATGVDYLVMERLRGEDLSQRMARTPLLPIEAVLDLGLELADALCAVHEAGIVHRDLKPANIFLEARPRREQVKLLDFGVAKQLDMQTLTKPGQTLGTLAYMAPEQMTLASSVDARSDLYSLGVVLYEGLAGRRPFLATAAPELCREIVFAEVPDLRTLRPDVPESLAEVVARCMQRRSIDRWASARELAAALHALSTPRSTMA